MPNTTGRFHLYSDTSKFAAGSALYQMQNSKPKPIAYASKRLPEAAKKLFYYWTRTMWISQKHSQFLSLVKKSWLWCISGPSITYIIKSKAELATIRIKRLLELISSYSFNLYYIKGTDMVLSDFWSRQNNDNSNPHEIIPISFNMYQVLHEKYYNIDNYFIQTWSQTRSSGIKLPEVHGMRKNLDPNIKPEK